MADLIFKNWWELWLLRNGDRHGRDSQTKAQADKRQAIREISLLYDMKHKVAQAYHYIFDRDLNTIVQGWTTTAIRAWVYAHRQVIEGGYTDALATG